MKIKVNYIVKVKDKSFFENKRDELIKKNGTSLIPANLLKYFDPLYINYCGKEAVVEDIKDNMIYLDITKNEMCWLEDMLEISEITPKVTNDIIDENFFELLATDEIVKIKQFKVGEEILVKSKLENMRWTYTLFSHYEDSELGVIARTVGAGYALKYYDIIPYKGNERLLGTNINDLDKGVYKKVFYNLKPNEYVVHVLDADSGLFEVFTFDKVNENSITVFNGASYCNIDRFIKFSDFVIRDIQGSVKNHTLKVENGFIVDA